MKSEKYDIAVLGAGPGGYIAALRAEQLGYKTVIIEKEKIGGMSLNWGMIPSKSLIASADLFQKIRQAESFGLTGLSFDKVMPDWQKMNERAAEIATQYVESVSRIIKRSGIKTIFGQGNVVDAHTLAIGNKKINFDNLIIATGSSYPILPNSEDVKNFHTPKTIYSIKELPKKMIIIGAGVIGVEFALLFSNLGVKVELIDRSSCFMSYLDHDMYQALIDTLQTNNVKIRLEASVQDISSHGLTIKQAGITKVHKADVYLSTVTRKAELNGLENLIDNKLELRNGYIRTDLRSRTTLPNIYAIGDVNGRFMLAHVAAKEAVTAIETIHGTGRDLVYDLMPYYLYANPEFASVGLTESQARKEGFLVETKKLPVTLNGKALASNQTNGFIKVIYEKGNGEILGVHIASHNATDLINEAVIAMQMKSNVWDVAFAVHPHPTMSETYLEAAIKDLDK